jgi:hypothetical protein
MLKLVELNSNANSVLDNPANYKDHFSCVGDLGIILHFCSYDSGRAIWCVYFPRIDCKEYWFEEFLYFY